MDEELMNLDIQETTEILVEEKIEELQIEESSTTEVTTEEEIDDIGVTTEDPVVIDMSEGMGWVSGDNRYHNSLLGIDYPSQHPIAAISGLREELDELERIKTVIADKTQIANYYQWADDRSYDTYGYFVSFVPNTSTIRICDGADIFGVSVETAGFIGQQEPLMSNINTYGLIVTSGLALVRCELDVEVGDYVISNSIGCAAKAVSTSGYKVLARANKKGVEYAAIMLGVQADVTHSLGVGINSLDNRLKAAESNIISAVNVANQAYNKSNEIIISNQEMSNKVDGALDKVEDMATEMENIGTQVAESETIAAQAKAIAESAIAFSVDVEGRANEAWSKADQVATEAYSLCAKIDEYSVGEYSQAYGLTYDQAQNILQVGMKYVPTKHVDKDTHEEIYTGEHQDYKRSFTPGFLYMWGGLPAGGYGWITVDKNYEVLTDETNVSSMAVCFAAKEPIIAVGDHFGYWYTNTDDVEDNGGKMGTYKPYTLYKWEVDHWVAVATLKGNASNRMVSEVYQTTNQITMGVSNPRGCIAALDGRVTDTNAEVTQLVAWKNGDETSEAIIRQHTENGNASIVISTLQKNDGVVDKMASLVLNTSKDGDALMMSADNIILEGDVILTTKDESDGKTKINGANIATKSITAEHLTADAIQVVNIDASQIISGTIQSKNYQYSSGNYSQNGVAIDLDTGYIRSKNFALNTNGDAYFNGTITATSLTANSGGAIAGWTMGKNSLTKGTHGSSDFIGFYSQYGTTDFTIGNVKSQNWRIIAGNKFGVTREGYLSASNVDISGTITATDGKIGGWNIDDDIMYSDEDWVSVVSPNIPAELDYKTYVKMTPLTIGYKIMSAGNYCMNTASWGSIINSVNTWYEEDSGLSDVNYKQNIEIYPKEYEAFFDSLRPVRYKYISGTSGRFHTGFIAQEVVKSLEQSSLTTQDFAGVMLTHQGEPDEHWRLRRDEFVALNTWQIQKAKARIAELEERVAKLESSINEQKGE